MKNENINQDEIGDEKTILVINMKELYNNNDSIVERTWLIIKDNHEQEGGMQARFSVYKSFL